LWHYNALISIYILFPVKSGGNGKQLAFYWLNSGNICHPRGLNEYRRVSTAHKLFDNVFQDDSLNFWGGPGQSLDYERVRDVVGLTNSDLSRVAHVAKNSVRFDERIPPALKERMEQIANCSLMVARYFNGDARKVSLWFGAPNPMLGNVSPRDMIRYGRFLKLQRFISGALTEASREPQS
jgi:hypothetical protein